MQRTAATASTAPNNARNAANDATSTGAERRACARCNSASADGRGESRVVSSTSSCTSASSFVMKVGLARMPCAIRSTVPAWARIALGNSRLSHPLSSQERAAVHDQRLLPLRSTRVLARARRCAYRRGVASSPHEALFRFTFGLSEKASALLRSSLPSTLAERVDWDSLELTQSSFVDASAEWRHSDLVFTARVGPGSAFIYVLLEHQSSADPLLGYIARLWKQVRARWTTIDPAQSGAYRASYEIRRDRGEFVSVKESQQAQVLTGVQCARPKARCRKR